MQVTTVDGLRLAVRVEGPVDAPVVLCVHGYPDNGSLWDGVHAELAGQYRVVSFDLRGAGRSEVPQRRRRNYRLDLLAADVVAVGAAVSPAAPIHLLAHDWGSAICWHAITDPALAHLFSGFTSISGPCPDHLAHWLRTPREQKAKWRQLFRSWYVAFFQLPLLPERRMDRLWMARTRPGPPPEGGDVRNGLLIYRANTLPRVLRPQQRRTAVPVQVLAPREDPLVGAAAQRASQRFTADLCVRDVPGGHWLPLENPALIAETIRESCPPRRCSDSSRLEGRP
ncbi:alpha/beta fold hydrolase [Mycolicibacterium lutetiense]